MFKFSIVSMALLSAIIPEVWKALQAKCIVEGLHLVCFVWCAVAVHSILL